MNFDITRLGEFTILVIAILTLVRLVRPLLLAYIDERKQGIDLQKKTLKRFEDGDAIIDRNTTVLEDLGKILDKSISVNKAIADNVNAAYKSTLKNGETLTALELDLKYLRGQYDIYYAKDGEVVAKIDYLLKRFNEMQHEEADRKDDLQE